MNNEMTISNQATVPSTQIVLDKQQQTWWNSLTQKQRDVIVSLAIVLGISVVGFIAIKFASSKVKDFIANNTENGSFGNNPHTTWAKQLKMAFDNDGWWGTDEQGIRRVLISMPSQEDFLKVQTQYKRLYKGRNLIVDLTDELQGTEYNEMLAILKSKPKKSTDTIEGSIYDPYGWARRLYYAMSIYYMGIIPGTDEDAIQAVFSEMKTQKEFADTKEAYQVLYNTSLEEDLDGDLKWSMDWRAIINKKPNY